MRQSVIALANRKTIRQYTNALLLERSRQQMIPHLLSTIASSIAQWCANGDQKGVILAQILAHTRRQIFFDAVDQLRKTDRLGQEWMPLDPQAGSTLGLRHQSRQKDNRYSVQCRIGLNPSGNFAAVYFRHCDIEENKVWLQALGCLMSFARVVFFTDELPAGSLQRELSRVRKIAVVIDYQDAGLLIVGSTIGGRKLASTVLFIIFLAPRLAPRRLKDPLSC